MAHHPHSSIVPLSGQDERGVARRRRRKILPEIPGQLSIWDLAGPGPNQDPDADAAASVTPPTPPLAPASPQAATIAADPPPVTPAPMTTMLSWPLVAAPDADVWTGLPDHADQWPVEFGEPRYHRDHGAYTEAQQGEKAGFLKLLHELCSGVPEPPQSMGRPRMATSDMVFSMALKVYTCFSLRRFTTDLRAARDRGYIGRTPNFNTTCKYFCDPRLTHILMDLVTASALPLKGLEKDFLMDSTGFSTCRFVRWYNKKHGRVTDNREWVKLHLTCGANTKIVTAVEVSGWQAHDTTFFEPMLKRTVEHFDVESVAADKAYLSRKNYHLAMLADAVLYVPFKSNTRVPLDTDNSMWAQMYHFFRFNQQEFYRHYHLRSNVESAVHMIKSKLGDYLRSRTTVAQFNEVLCKVLCHNIIETHKTWVMLKVDR